MVKTTYSKEFRHSSTVSTNSSLLHTRNGLASPVNVAILDGLGLVNLINLADETVGNNIVLFRVN
jgi:hypothetical protein